MTHYTTVDGVHFQLSVIDSKNVPKGNVLYRIKAVQKRPDADYKSAADVDTARAAARTLKDAVKTALDDFRQSLEGAGASPPEVTLSTQHPFKDANSKKGRLYISLADDPKNTRRIFLYNTIKAAMDELNQHKAPKSKTGSRTQSGKTSNTPAKHSDDRLIDGGAMLDTSLIEGDTDPAASVLHFDEESPEVNNENRLRSMFSVALQRVLADQEVKLDSDTQAAVVKEFMNMLRENNYTITPPDTSVKPDQIQSNNSSLDTGHGAPN